MPNSGEYERLPRRGRAGRVRMVAKAEDSRRKARRKAQKRSRVRNRR